MRPVKPLRGYKNLKSASSEQDRAVRTSRIAVVRSLRYAIGLVSSTPVTATNLYQQNAQEELHTTVVIPDTYYSTRKPTNVGQARVSYELRRDAFFTNFQQNDLRNPHVPVNISLTFWMNRISADVLYLVNLFLEDVSCPVLNRTAENKFGNISVVVRHKITTPTMP